MRSWFLFVFLNFTKVMSLSASDKKRSDEAAGEKTCGRGIPTPSTFMNRSCYYVETPDALPYADGGIFFFPENSIFFIETSCKGGLNFREACSVESAARAHPNRHIIVLFIGPVHKSCLEDEPMISLRSYKKVKFYRIHLHKYVEGTPLEKIFISERYNGSRYPVYHTSSLLRFLTLYKYGGIYLDLDVIVLRPFDDLPEPRDWVGLEDAQGQKVGASLISASTEGIGRLFIDAAIDIVKKEYKRISWIHDTGNIIKMALEKICSTSMLLKMTNETCSGFSVYPVDYFYQLYAKHTRDKFFDKGYWYNPKNAFAVHLMHSVTYKNVIFDNSTFTNIIHEFCPQIHQNTLIVSDIQIMGPTAKSVNIYKKRTTTVAKITWSLKNNFINNPEKLTISKTNIPYQSTTEFVDRVKNEMKQPSIELTIDDIKNKSKIINTTEVVYHAIDLITTEIPDYDIDELTNKPDILSPTSQTPVQLYNGTDYKQIFDSFTSSYQPTELIWFKNQSDISSPTVHTPEVFDDYHLDSDTFTINLQPTTSDILLFVNPYEFKYKNSIQNNDKEKHSKVKDRKKTTWKLENLENYHNRTEFRKLVNQFKRRVWFTRSNKFSNHTEIFIPNASKSRRKKKKNITIGIEETTMKIPETSTAKYEIFWRREQYPSDGKKASYFNKFSRLVSSC